MPRIDQIYCTHCTYGSSALERRQGELAHRPLGYSARAASIERGELRNVYRQIERYLYYYLYSDAPPDYREKVDPEEAPRRLVYVPLGNGLQMLAQICYRKTDTAGRLGSYFGHVLLNNSKQEQSWSPLDGLRLWAASGWKKEETQDITHHLNSLHDLVELDGRRAMAVSDAVLRSFLTAENGRCEDPHGIIPDRWKKAPAEKRQQLLKDLLHGFLEMDPARRESLLLVAEPEFAALLFYGLIRLLPPGDLVNQLSFSTFEPNADRVCTTLAATVFYNKSADLRPDAYRGRGFVLHTFLPERPATPFRHAKSNYAAYMVGLFCTSRPEKVDELLEWFKGENPRTFADFDDLVLAEKAAPALLHPQGSPQRAMSLLQSMGRRYLRKAICRELLGRVEQRLGPLVEGPESSAAFQLLEILGIETQPRIAEEAVHYLLARLPEDRIGDVLKHEGIATNYKAFVLANYLRHHDRLPREWEGVWSELQTSSRVPTATLQDQSYWRSWSVRPTSTCFTVS
jgi:hypothetical protein